MVSISILSDFFCFSKRSILPILKALSKVASGPIDKSGTARDIMMPKSVPKISTKSNIL